MAVDAAKLKDYTAAAERIINAKMHIFTPLMGNYQVAVHFGENKDWERSTGEAIGWVTDIQLLAIAVERMAKELGHD